MIVFFYSLRIFYAASINRQLLANQKIFLAGRGHTWLKSFESEYSNAIIPVTIQSLGMRVRTPSRTCVFQTPKIEQKWNEAQENHHITCNVVE